MAKRKRIYGAGGGGGGGGNQVVQQTVNVQAPVYQPTYTPDDPGLRSNSFAQLQFLLSEGEVEGPAEGNTREGLERSVYLDNTPVRVGDSVVPQPDDLVISYGKPGSLQSGAPGFSQVSTPFGVDTEVRFGLPVAQSVTAADPQAPYRARVLLTFAGLVRTTGQGDVLGTSVSLTISYTDINDVERTPYNTTVSGKFSGQFQREFEFELEGAGPWRVTVTRNTADDSTRSSGGTSYRSTFNFSTVVLSLDQRFSYPYSSVLSLGIRADQYSALPNVSIDMKGMILDVPSNYDPETRIYTGVWDGTFQRAYSNNPAWVLRDIIVHDRYGLGQYIDADQIDKWTLYSIAQYCDELVPSDNGGTEPRFTCNLILQTSEEAWNVLQQISSVFRGLLYYAAGTIVSIQDRPGQFVYTFNESNTIEEFDDSGKVSQGNFVYAGSARRARHTAALASWDDPLDNYQPRVEYIADEEGIARFGYRPMDLRLLGVTSRGQALRAANWALLSESLLTDTVAFRTNEIGSAVRPGDLIKIADPTKAARRYGGRIKAVNPAGTVVTLDDSPPEPPGGWGGSTFSYMTADANGEPVLNELAVASVNGDTVNLAVGPNPPLINPMATFPWLLESPDRTAQPFRVLTVEEQEDGIYAFTALRYREDLYNTVDFDTPLEDNEAYLYKAITPGAPTITRAEVIWDNNSAKLNVEWEPSDTNAVLNGFDLSLREYRFQYQSGELQGDGVTVIYDEAWREIERQNDNREQIPIDQYVSTDRFRVRLCAVSRIGVESDWVESTVTPIEEWFPMPDIADRDPDTAEPNATFQHFNQSTGGQLFSWELNADSVPPYVNGIELSAKPSRELTPQEAAGLETPDADGYYFIAAGDRNDYYGVAFHALVNWEARIRLTTSVPGLFGETYLYDSVDRLELVPPIPQQFVVVTEPTQGSSTLTRRFSWDFTEDPPFVEKWPLSEVSDIVAYDIRFKAGSTVDWDLGFPMFSDGIPGDQKWFETTLFQSGQWVVMLRPRDRTGWQSDEIAFVSVNLADAVPTNVVERTDLKDLNFPGELDNCTRDSRPDGAFYPDPQTALLYQAPLDDDFYEGGAGNVLVQTSVEAVANYYYPFVVSDNGVGLLVYTQSNATYQWFLKKEGGAIVDLMYPAPTTDAMYEEPQSGYFYVTLTPGLSEEYHPLANFERIDAGLYTLACQFSSADGVALGEIYDVDVILDYPDLVETFNDELVPPGGRRFDLTQSFRVLKAVNITLQDSPDPGVPQVVMVTGKDSSGFNARCYDLDGNDVAGLLDATCVGY